MGVILRTLRMAVGAGLLALALTMMAVVLTSRAIPSTAALELGTPVDAAIVLGAGVEGDGRLAYSSRRRVAGAVGLLRRGEVGALIFTGGIGRYHPASPAARLMRDHAIELGADPDVLFVEPLAVSTFENLRFSLPLASAEGFETLLVVSDRWHLPRAKMLAGFFGAPDLPLAAVPGQERDWWPVQAVMLVREALAWWLNVGKIVGWQGLGLLGLSPGERVEYIR